MPQETIEPMKPDADDRTFRARTGKDLLGQFSAATQPVIVKFRSPSQHGNELLHAVNYAYCRVHDLEINRNVTLSFSGDGVPVPRSSLLAIEEIGKSARDSIRKAT
jgi:hypothetical protein